MNTHQHIEKIGAALDAKRDLLLHIKQINPAVYFRLLSQMKDKLTYSDMESALLHAIAGVGIVFIINPEDQSISVDFLTSGGGTFTEVFYDWDSALRYAIGLLYIVK